MANLSDLTKTTIPREFDLSCEMTLEEIFDKLNARASAFEMPFSIKGGIGGPKISFEKHKELDVVLNVTVKGNKVKVQPNISESQTTVGVGGASFRTDKNSVLKKGVGGVVDLPFQRGAYIDKVTDTIKKILNNEPVEDYVAAQPIEAEAQPSDRSDKDWLTTLLLFLFLGGIGVHRFYVGKIGTGILYILTLGVFGIGYIVDFIKILIGKFTDKQGRPVKRK
ncbi:MAG: TM2 domain-containing protein [Acutalibacteraceae bacterium]